jgi:predicted double-glycine peptidase
MSRRPHRRVVVGVGGVCALWACGVAATGLAAEPSPAVVQVEAAGGLRLRKPVRTFKEFRRQRAILQRYDYSCGAASLAIILQHFYKLPVTEESVVGYIIEKRGVDQAVQRYQQKKGFSLLDLKLAATSAGFRCLAYRDMTLPDLVELDAPVIVPIRTREYDHFVVFRGLLGDRVYFTDPIVGNLTMKAANFTAVWHDGIGMVLKSSHGWQPQDWRPDKATQGFYVSQDQLRNLAQRGSIGFMPRGPGEF